MKTILITGASGFVAEQIIPLLGARDIPMVLLARDVAALTEQYPNYRCHGRDDMEAALKGVDVVLHLAACNNDRAEPLDVFRAENVTATADLLATMKHANVKHIIFASSLHADTAADGSYSKTKGEAEELLLAQDNVAVTIFRLAAVYGSQMKGNLAMVQKFPKLLQPLAFNTMASLRPVLHAPRLVDSIVDALDQPQGTLILSDRQIKNPVYLGLMKAVDLIFAAFIAGLFWWVFLIIWIAIRWDSKGPGLFIQDRVGRGGKVFKCYKFRTMKIDTVQAGSHEVSESQITRLGLFLRKTKVDELPQIINILRNELSLIGPRPCLPVQDSLIKKRISRGVLDVKPGMSGLAQIKNIDMSEPSLLALEDQNYIAMRTVPLDLKIILRTATGAGQGDKTNKK